jgi:nucleoporin NUP159
MAGNAPTTQVGGEIQDFATEVAPLRPYSRRLQLTLAQHLGFRALSQGAEGPKKLKLLKPWPSNSVPPASATLLSIASKPGLLAAAGPDTLIVVSTEKVRKAFSGKAGEWDVISDFTPDVAIPLGNPPLRHVLFSAGGEFLVISAEAKGGLAVFDVTKLMKGNQMPDQHIQTDGVAVRMLQANPVPEMEHYMTVVLDTGKLWLVDITSGKINTLKDGGVSCVTWSNRGKAVAAGMQDGTSHIYMSDGSLKGVIPRPPGVDDNYEVAGLTWLKNSELLVVHSPKPSADVEPENKYHLVECNKTWTEFEFHATIWDPLLTSIEGPPRALPPRFSATRLQNWAPNLDDMLIITTSHTDAIEILTSSSKVLSPEQADAAFSKWVITPPEDTKKAAVPRLVFGEEGDSVLVGEGLDLSATEKILRPIAALEEIHEAPHPLPAYMVLTHQGVLMAWWVVWNKSIEEGTRYPGLVSGSEQTSSTPQSAKVAAAPSPAPPAFGQSLSTFGRPNPSPASSTLGQPGLAFGQPSTPAAPSSTAAPSAFAKAAATFGSTAVSVPQFGATGLGSTPPFLAKSSQPFGSTASTTPAAPAFGAPSAMGAAKSTGFGAVGGMGNKPSPWATPAQPASTPQTQANPFSAAASGTSGFAKFGQANGGSGFSSFGSNSGAPSGFGSFGQPQQKSAFPDLKTEPSGSTITIGSSAGSSLPSWANTPAQQGSVFGKTSFDTSSFESKTSDTSATEGRKRDEATPTPQPPKGLFGGFQLGSTFKGDGTAKDDLPKPKAPSTDSLFGGGFASALNDKEPKPPATPAKETGKESAQDISTTPVSPPRQQNSFFSSATPAKGSATPKAPPPAESTTDTGDAPLPPDFLPTKPQESTDDDLPPLAGSPGVKVEAPSSSVEASPFDQEDGEDESDFSDQDDEGDESEEDEEEAEDIEEPSPSDATRRPQSKTGTWSFEKPVDQSPRVFPPAPTPPVKPAQSKLFGETPKPAQATSIFAQPQKAGPTFGFSNKPNESSTPAKPLFPPPTNRAQDLRSPSPVRSLSASAPRTRREPITAPGSSLSASMQQVKTPTPPPPQVADLEDEEDERMRAQLAQKIEPSRTLDEFTAYQNYTGKSLSKTGHAAQIEMVYKDLNGMIDSLGWNVRSIKSFTEYHKRPQSGHQLDRRTLEEIAYEGESGSWFEQWTLSEIQGLKSLEDELEQELDAGRVQDVLGKLSQLARLLHDKAKLMTRLNDVRRQIINRKDPDKVEASRKAPLSKEMADKQKQLRKEYALLLTKLSQAEDTSILLRTRLASHNAQNGNARGVPTVDAVKRTILRMTEFAENHNNDLTVIESRMRKLGLSEPSRPSSSSSRNMGTPRRSRGTSLRNSIADTPFATPPMSRSKMSLSELNRRALTPDIDTTPTANKGYRFSYELSKTPGNELARMNDMVDDNIDALRQTAKRRREVAASLKKALLERGIKETKVHR